MESTQMSPLARRIAKALAAFRKSDGFSLTNDQYDALIDQMALACNDITGERGFNYDAFRDYAHK
jgi:hypothetical protein